MARHKNATINLPETFGNVRDWNSIKVGILMDIRDELQTLNTLLACRNFTQIPTTLRSIQRELATARKAKAK